MALRVERLADNLEGINRRRQKGGASKNDLIDLLNAYRTPLGTVNSRPGTSHEFAGPSNTKGLLGFAGKLHVFSHAPQSHSVPNLVVNVLKHPSGGAATISKITSVFPFYGRIYVVAKFTDGVVRHYWLENPEAWAAAHVYDVYGNTSGRSSTVQPTSPNGYYYDVTLSARVDLKWAKNTEKVANDIVQPTTYNGMYFILSGSSGTPIKTSNTEPSWPNYDAAMVPGAVVIERRWLSDPDQAPGVPTPSTPPDPSAGNGGPGGGAGNYGPFPPREDTIVFDEP
jgi:hypothetical protein